MDYLHSPDLWFVISLGGPHPRPKLKGFCPIVFIDTHYKDNVGLISEYN